MSSDKSAPSRFSEDAIRQIFDLSPDAYWIDEILELKIGVVDVNKNVQ